MSTQTCEPGNSRSRPQGNKRHDSDAEQEPGGDHAIPARVGVGLIPVAFTPQSWSRRRFPGCSSPNRATAAGQQRLSEREHRVSSLVKAHDWLIPRTVEQRIVEVPGMLHPARTERTSDELRRTLPHGECWETEGLRRSQLSSSQPAPQ